MGRPSRSATPLTGVMVERRSPRLPRSWHGVFVVALAGTFLLGPPALAGGGTTTAEVPSRRAETTTVLRTSTADAPVQVNVDIGMQVGTGRRCTGTLPGACKGRIYHPCFNLDDPANAGCQLYTLYRVLNAGTTVDLAQGIAITNSSTSRDGRIINHRWGSKVTQSDLEFYAFDPDQRFGDARMRVSSFPEVINGTAYSEMIGNINLPGVGDPDVGSLIGRALDRNGRPMAPRSFKLDLFGHANTAHRTGLLNDHSFTLYGFGGAHVAANVVDGSFASKPLWAGAYDVHIQRTGASFRCGVDIVAGKPVRLDLYFSRRNLGQPRCKPMGSLAQGVPG